MPKPLWFLFGFAAAFVVVIGLAMGPLAIIRAGQARVLRLPSRAPAAYAAAARELLEAQRAAA
mgnify:CR=1 FL=1